jgi:hypothetical protein
MHAAPSDSPVLDSILGGYSAAELAALAKAAPALARIGASQPAIRRAPVRNPADEPVLVVAADLGRGGESIPAPPAGFVARPVAARFLAHRPVADCGCVACVRDRARGWSV